MAMNADSSTRRSWPLRRIRVGLFLVSELFLRVVVHPGFRAQLLRLLGADVGKNVRVYEARFINLNQGFQNLTIGDDVHVGTGTLIDLQGTVVLKRGATMSPRVTILTHNDPGSSHNSPLCRAYPPTTDGVVVGEYAWIGAGAVVLDGTRLGDLSVVGAGSVISGNLESRTLYAGVPARRVKSIDL